MKAVKDNPSIMTEDEWRRVVNTHQAEQIIPSMRLSKDKGARGRTKRYLAQQVAVELLESGYLEKGHSVRFVWSEESWATEGRGNVIITLRAYVIKDLEPAPEPEIRPSFSANLMPLVRESFIHQAMEKDGLTLEEATKQADEALDSSEAKVGWLRENLKFDCSRDAFVNYYLGDVPKPELKPLTAFEARMLIDHKYEKQPKTPDTEYYMAQLKLLPGQKDVVPQSLIYKKGESITLQEVKEHIAKHELDVEQLFHWVDEQWVKVKEEK